MPHGHKAKAIHYTPKTIHPEDTQPLSSTQPPGAVHLPEPCSLQQHLHLTLHECNTVSKHYKAPRVQSPICSSTKTQERLSSLSSPSHHHSTLTPTPHHHPAPHETHTTKLTVTTQPQPPHSLPAANSLLQDYTDHQCHTTRKFHKAPVYPPTYSPQHHSAP